MGSDLLGLKLLVGLAALPLIFQLYYMWRLGKKLAVTPDNQLLLEDKRDSYGRLAWFLVVAIALIEMLVHVSPVHRALEDTWLFRVHITAAVSFVLLMGILWRQTGVRSRTFHRYAGYTALGLITVVLITGSVFVAQL